MVRVETGQQLGPEPFHITGLTRRFQNTSLISRKQQAVRISIPINRNGLHNVWLRARWQLPLAHEQRKNLAWLDTHTFHRRVEILCVWISQIEEWVWRRPKDCYHIGHWCCGWVSEYSWKQSYRHLWTQHRALQVTIMRSRRVISARHVQPTRISELWNALLNLVGVTVNCNTPESVNSISLLNFRTPTWFLEYLTEKSFFWKCGPYQMIMFTSTCVYNTHGAGNVHPFRAPDHFWHFKFGICYLPLFYLICLAFSIHVVGFTSSCLTQKRLWL